MCIITHICPVVPNTIVQLNLPQLKEKQAEEMRRRQRMWEEQKAAKAAAEAAQND